MKKAILLASALLFTLHMDSRHESSALSATPPGSSTTNENSAAPAGDTALKETLVALEKQSWVAWKSRDGKFFQDFLSDDHIEVSAGGVSGKSVIVPFVASDKCVVKSYELDHFELTAFNASTAVLTYHAAQDTICFGQPVPSPTWVSSLYVKRAGRWLNALYQHSPASK